jgi:hypothetical protein
MEDKFDLISQPLLQEEEMVAAVVDSVVALVAVEALEIEVDSVAEEVSVVETEAEVSLAVAVDSVAMIL